MRDDQSHSLLLHLQSMRAGSVFSAERLSNEYVVQQRLRTVRCMPRDIAARVWCSQGSKRCKLLHLLWHPPTRAAGCTLRPDRLLEFLREVILLANVRDTCEFRRACRARADGSSHWVMGLQAGLFPVIAAFQSCMNAIQLLLKSYRSDLARTQYCETNCIR